MKNSRYFLSLVLLTTVILFFVDLPGALKLGSFQLPLINRTLTLNPNSLNIDIWPFNITREFDYSLGLDLQGGTQIAYQLDMSEIETEDRQDALESARSVIERRINLFGVSEPNIQTIELPDNYRIIVELPGLEDESQAVDLIGKTAQLTFWEGSDTPVSPSAELAFDLSATESANSFPPGLDILLGSEPQKTDLTGKDLDKAQVSFSQQTGVAQVQIDFDSKGAELFADITKRNVGEPVAIVLDDQILSAPIVQQAIVGGSAVISGSFTPESAKNLSIQLNAGALPAPLEIVSQSKIGATLGINALNNSLIGALIGLLSVAAFMIFIYKKEGVMASVALFVYTVIVLFVFKFIPVTLTLAGIAGFILSVGMAVDANILIFERIKEERRNGRESRRAVQLGFQRAWSSIRDSNVSSLITTAILFYFGSGIIRGFALTLAIGILVSMFSAITVTKRLLELYEKD